MRVFCLHASLYTTWMPGDEAIRSPWNWSYLQLGDALEVPGTKPWIFFTCSPLSHPSRLRATLKNSVHLLMYKLSKISSLGMGGDYKKSSRLIIDSEGFLPSNSSPEN